MKKTSTVKQKFKGDAVWGLLQAVVGALWLLFSAGPVATCPPTNHRHCPHAHEGLLPHCCTLQFLSQGEVVFKDLAKVMTVNYKTHGELGEGTRKSVFSTYLRFNTKSHECRSWCLRTGCHHPSCLHVHQYLHSGEQVLLDVETKNNKEVIEYIKKSWGRMRKPPRKRRRRKAAVSPSPLWPWKVLPAGLYLQSGRTDALPRPDTQGDDGELQSHCESQCPRLTPKATVRWGDCDWPIGRLVWGYLGPRQALGSVLENSGNPFTIKRFPFTHLCKRAWGEEHRQPDIPAPWVNKRLSNHCNKTATTATTTTTAIHNIPGFRQQNHLVGLSLDTFPYVSAWIFLILVTVAITSITIPLYLYNPLPLVRRPTS